MTGMPDLAQLNARRNKANGQFGPGSNTDPAPLDVPAETFPVATVTGMDGNHYDVMDEGDGIFSLCTIDGTVLTTFDDDGDPADLEHRAMDALDELAEDGFEAAPEDPWAPTGTPAPPRRDPVTFRRDEVYFTFTTPDGDIYGAEYTGIDDQYSLSNADGQSMGTFAGVGDPHNIAGVTAAARRALAALTGN